MPSLLRLFIATRGARFAAVVLLVLFAVPSRAAVNTLNLGAHYDATAANINFRVSSSRATTPSAATSWSKCSCRNWLLASAPNASRAR